MVLALAEAVLISESRLLDPAVLLATCDGDAALLGRVIASLRANLPKELSEAQAQLDAGDARGLREQAHRLQGMISAASTVGAMVASELEDEAANDRLDTSAALLARLDAMTTTLLADLEEISIDEILAASSADDRPR
jgi:HPt (histidine-containing phosphotransfer) domain-containing protein